MRPASRDKRTSPRCTRRGLVLVAAVGVLGVLSVMGLTFSTVMRLEARAARNFSSSVHADFVARSGVEDAIARLRSMVRDGAEFPYENGEPAGWYTWRGTAGGGWKISFPTTEGTNGLDDDGDGRMDQGDPNESPDLDLAYTDWLSSSMRTGGDNYTLRVQDAASKVNVNTGDNLGTVLDNLCRVIGPPLVSADQRALVPRWFARKYPQYGSPQNAGDVKTQRDFFYRIDGEDRPVVDNMGKAVFGDGYAIAGHRSRNGAFLSVEDVRNALTWIERGDGDGDDEIEADLPEEVMELEAKFAALRPYITIDSWADTDQIGSGKFEHIVTSGVGNAVALVDRNKTWNTTQNDGAGELQGCFLAIINGVGQGQLKTIARNTIDTIELSNSEYPGSEMNVPPNHESSYIIIGKDHSYASSLEEWYNETKLYAKQPLSIHRAPVNVNTATGTVLSALVMGLQTNWGPAGYYANEAVRAVVGHWYSLCPSVLSIGRDGFNAHLTFDLPCPNDSRMSGKFMDPILAKHGHAAGGPPHCFFCNYGRPYENAHAGNVSEAHYIAWQILKEREQTKVQDEHADNALKKYSNGHGPFKGWDELYFRVFRPWERASAEELRVEAPALDRNVYMLPGTASAAALSNKRGKGSGHPGIARLCMANFNSNTDILKFQPNLEWINRWGANFTDLYLSHPMTGKDVKQRIRPGEMIDKTDLNIATTEFSFDSGGVYEVESTGRVYDDSGVVAEKKYAALVRVYDVWRESTQREFVAGSITRAAGAPGSCFAGQVAADMVTQSNWRGGRVERKTLCTYPEPVVPGTYRGADGAPAPLALNDRKGIVVKPAGYDGCIMIATNSIMMDASENPDPTISFYDSFTGQVSADFAKGNPMVQPDPNGYLPIDEVGLLGAINSKERDLLPVKDARTGEYIEGEGKGGDLRPDGLYLGIVGTARLDGSFGFKSQENMHSASTNQGTISMWVKANWHHGTFTRPSLPINFLNNNNAEKGSTVVMERHPHWPGSDYSGITDRDSPGYVRDRFEHELFSATEAGVGYGAHGFQFQNCAWGQRIGSLWAYIEDDRDMDFRTFIPGYLHALDKKPYYRIAPFRWHFLGLSWNYLVSGREAVLNKHTERPDTPFGLPYEFTGSWTHPASSLEEGYEYGNDPVDGSTPYMHVSLVLLGRMFVDTMRTWNQRLPEFAGGSTEEKLQAWAYQQYGTNINTGSFPMQARHFKDFGINRAMPEGEHLYQSKYWGTYATVDEFMISNKWHDSRFASPSGIYWPQERYKTGRYYFDKTGRLRPQFESQNLYGSESAQSFTFSDEERDEVVELGTVRWTVFTPYYCIHQPKLPDYEFPYDTYFLESEDTGLRTRMVSQSWRPGPSDWISGPESRNSSQRGCSVIVRSGPSPLPSHDSVEYVDPEAWSPILARGSFGGRHARATPQHLKYVVRFGFSREEYHNVTPDSVLLDSPVFDDITITYMRRPKILAWRDVSE